MISTKALYEKPMANIIISSLKKKKKLNIFPLIPGRHSYDFYSAQYYKSKPGKPRVCALGYTGDISKLDFCDNKRLSLSS